MSALRVAIVGAGPAGMYAAGHLLKQQGTYLDGRSVRLTTIPVEVDVFDRLPTPYGLVRHGVAPHHPEKKRITTEFDKIAELPGFRFFGNVDIGHTITAADLSQWYDAVIYAVGANGDTTLGIPGERLPGSFAAREFVGWYSGHPDHRDLDVDLSHSRAVVIGNGNVALDIARVLLAPIDELARTDIAAHALDALRDSKIREVVLLGRRSNRHAACTNPELEELGDLPGVDIHIDFGSSPKEFTDTDHTVERKLTTLRRYTERPTHTHDRRLNLRFLTSPTEIIGTDHVTALSVVANAIDDSGIRPTEVTETLDTGLVLRAIGYSGTAIPGLPFDPARGLIPHADGRITASSGSIPGAYVTGWIKRGPRGIIGTNKKCARDTVRALLHDAASGLLDTETTMTADAVTAEIRKHKPEFVDWIGWQRIDIHELTEGAAIHRPRLKLTEAARLLTVARR